MSQHRIIHLFRKGLCLHDNLSLVGGPGVISVCVPCVRPGHAHWGRVEDPHRSLQVLGSRLYVHQGPYQGTVMRLVAQWGITQLSMDTEIEPHYTQLDQQHRIMAGEPTEGEPPLPYKFLHVLSNLGEPDKPAKEITAPDFQQLRSTVKGSTGFPLWRIWALKGSQMCCWPGGESHALMSVSCCPFLQGLVANLSKPRTIPNSLLPSTTGLSPYLSLGCLSVWAFYHRLSKVYAQSKNHSLPLVSLQGQVLWREFFYTVVSAMAKFTKMEGNSICLQIGLTWIDAIMTQLRQECWIHHLARHAVACFLTRGDLWISWEEGMKVKRNGEEEGWREREVEEKRPVHPLGGGHEVWLLALKSCGIPLLHPDHLMCLGNNYPLFMVSHQEASQRNLDLMRQICNEQENTTLLTRGTHAADDPMEIRLKKDGGVAYEERGAKRFSPDTNYHRWNRRSCDRHAPQWQ
uniref:Cryptochrome circadian regulator 4 n=1 Tax=Hucho hucho TaxID=62062 RepID=A0A4W5L8N1_9TELE